MLGAGSNRHVLAAINSVLAAMAYVFTAFARRHAESQDAAH